MSPRTHRRLWWSVGGLVFLLAASVTIDGTMSRYDLEPQIGSTVGCGFRSDMQLHQCRVRGWPLALSSSRRDVRMTYFSHDFGRQRPPVLENGPWRYSGSNPAVPVAAGLLAVCLPVVVCGPGLRRAGPPRSAGRVERAARAGLLAAAAGLLVTAVELETSPVGYDEPCPVHLLDRWLDWHLPPGTPGSGCRLESAVGLRPVCDWIALTRKRFEGSEELPGDGRWRRRTAFTVWAMVCFGGAATVSWKPWRRATPTIGPPA